MKTYSEITQAMKGLRLTDAECLALADAVLYGAWGDSEVTFADGALKFGWGYCTNDIRTGGHFRGRQVSALCSSISRKVKAAGCPWLMWCPDWWGDGTGDMMFIAVDFLSYDEAVAWAHAATAQLGSTSLK